MTMDKVERRICWPMPDRVCLQGGCTYCNDHPFRSVRSIHAYALRHDLIEAFDQGQEGDFHNAEMRVIPS